MIGETVSRSRILAEIDAGGTGVVDKAQVDVGARALDKYLGRVH